MEKSERKRVTTPRCCLDDADEELLVLSMASTSPSPASASPPWCCCWRDTPRAISELDEEDDVCAPAAAPGRP